MSQRPDQIIAEKYRLIRRLARGGMGAVWKARHLDLGIEVALKFVRSDGAMDSAVVDRFQREARAAASLKSPHVVQIHDYGVDSGTPYIAMELLEGEDFGQLLQRRGQLSLQEATKLVQEAGKGLLAVHQARLIHRDIKPQNIFLARQGETEVVKLLDFGIAKELNSDSTETTAGLVFGSPAYMSPEQARGGMVDERSDLWSLAVVFYQMATGTPPFGGANPSDIVVKMCTEAARPPSEFLAQSNEALDAFFRRALSRNPAERFADLGEFLLAVSQFDDEMTSWPAVGMASNLLPPANFSAGRSAETAPLTLDDGSEQMPSIEVFSPPLLLPSNKSLSASKRRGVLLALSLTLFFVILFFGLVEFRERAAFNLGLTPNPGRPVAPSVEEPASALGMTVEKDGKGSSAQLSPERASAGVQQGGTGAQPSGAVVRDSDEQSAALAVKKSARAGSVQSGSNGKRRGEYSHISPQRPLAPAEQGAQNDAGTTTDPIFGLPLRPGK